jgi:ABC-type uncharacterized transport system fused permease/ATPase subunit
MSQSKIYYKIKLNDNCTINKKTMPLIEKLSIDFSKGFSIITGETGAGKSIILHWFWY